MNNQSLLQRDLDVLWHPCTQMKDHEKLPMIPIERGEGVWLYDFDEKRYLDAISSWWVNLFGHSHPYINQAIANQIQALEHVLLAGFTHEAAVLLAEQLRALTGLDRCFYADNGSSAVEIALKMSYHAWHNQGNHRKTNFISLGNSYHGETLGALAVGDVALYKQTYEPLLMRSITVESPDCYFREKGETWEEYSRRQFQKMEETLEQHADEVCAVIVEPLVQCAGSMRMYHPIYLSLLREACDRYGVHLIADEIAVGFGRTGTMFACEQAGIKPDIMCLSKGLTGGYLPLSAVMTSDKIYQIFYDDYTKLTAFLHSHSYTGNALACRAALATLELFKKENTIEKNRTLASYMWEQSQMLADHPHVAEVRQSGMIVAIEMAKDKKSRTPFDWRERRGLRAYQHALNNEMLLRPVGNVLYFMPPYVINHGEIDLMVSVCEQAIDIATRDD